MELCVDFLRFIIQKMQHVVASKGEVQVYLQPAVKGKWTDRSDNTQGDNAFFGNSVDLC